VDVGQAHVGTCTFTAKDAGVHTFSVSVKIPDTQSLTAFDIANNSITGSQSGIRLRSLGNEKVAGTVSLWSPELLF
jgi:hypothetical protein